MRQGNMTYARVLAVACRFCPYLPSAGRNSVNVHRVAARYCAVPIFWRIPVAQTPQMETFRIPGTNLAPSRIGLGTWAIGGWMWGGTDEAESIRTIHAALDRGITLIDTAPVYGFGRSEEIVGKALAEEIGRAHV